jgi:hypothetical protein
VKRIKGFLFIAAALTLVMTACDGLDGDYKTVNHDLHGAWERTEPNYWYGGRLVLGIDTITLTGSFVHLPGFTRNITLEAYTELIESGSSAWKGLLYIKDRGAWQSPVQFTYWESGGWPKDKMLTFTGGSPPDETLKRIAD